MKNDCARIARHLHELAEERGPESTFCPSEAARRMDSERWRDWLPEVRAKAIRLVRAGELRCTQRGVEVDPETARGPIRLSLPSPRKLSGRLNKYRQGRGNSPDA